MAALWRRRMACSRPRCLHHYRHKQFLARRELVLGNDIEPGMLFPNSRGVTPKSFSKVRNVLETFIFLHDTEIFGETPHFSDIIVRSSPHHQVWNFRWQVRQPRERAVLGNPNALVHDGRTCMLSKHF